MDDDERERREIAEGYRWAPGEREAVAAEMAARAARIAGERSGPIGPKRSERAADEAAVPARGDTAWAQWQAWHQWVRGLEDRLAPARADGAQNDRPDGGR